MTTQAQMMAVLKSHRDIVKVTLDKTVNCSDFWGSLASDMYYSLPPDDQIDSKIRSALLDFGKVDDLDVVNKQGRILKRFAKFYKQSQDKPLTDALLGVIGDRLQYYINNCATDDSTFYVDFTDTIDWNDGQFGKEGSCWFPNGCYSDSRATYTAGGGWGIRFYQSDDNDYDNGIGRTWILPRDGMLFCFNAYGVHRATVSKVLKAVFRLHDIRLHYKVMESLYNSCDSEIPYINTDGSSGSSGAFVMYPDDMNADDVPTDYDIHMHIQHSDDDDNYENCTHCGRRIDTDYGEYNMINDDIYCERCTNNLFAYCNRCEDYQDINSVHKVHGDDEYICSNCAEHLRMELCENCSEYTDDYVNTDDTDDTYCLDCANEHLTFCEDCNLWFHDHDHELYASLRAVDTTGLIEVTGDFSICRGYGTERPTYTLTVYYVPDCSGLFLYGTHQIKDDSHLWNIAHESSGLAVKSDIEYFSQAKSILLRLAPVTDWNQTKDELIHNDSVMQAVQEIIYTQGH